MPRAPAFYLSQPATRRNLPPTLNRRTPKHSAHDAAVIPRGAIFVPFQVDSDMQITELSPWIKSMDALHRLLFDMVARDPNRVFVIKEHPMTRNTLCGRVARHPNIIFQNGRPTAELIGQCDAVLTVNSTVGIEALSLSRPVVVLGRAAYVVPGLVRQARDADALDAVLRDLPGWRPDPILRARYLAYVRHRFLFGGEGQPIDADLADRLVARLTGGHDTPGDIPGAAPDGAAALTVASGDLRKAG